MTAASARHRLLNLVQSALLLGLMAALAWVSVTVILGPGTGLLVALGMVHVPWSVVVLLIFAPTLMALIQLGLSRTREYDADRAAADLTGDPEGLIRALGKLDRLTGRFWEEIFLPGRRIPDPSLLRTHPPTESRVRRLRELDPNRSVPFPDIIGHSAGVAHASNLTPRFRRFGTYW